MLSASEMTVYLDLDGVLVDFARGALRFHKSDLAYESLDWDFDKKLGLTPEEFWGPLDYDFWVNLEWTKEGKEILSILESKFGERIAILSSPPKTHGAVDGKLDWIKREIPSYRRKSFIGARKELMAARNKLLVDDRQENLHQFAKAGGWIWTVPRPWNPLKARESMLIDDLMRFLNYF